LVCGFDAMPLSREAIVRSRLAVMDCIGVALAGSREPVSGIVREQALETAGRPQATVWGTSHQVPLLDAALVNGTMAHALDYDDMNRATLGHPSAVLVPAIFALGETLRLPGRRLLQAYVLGLEAMARLGRIFGTQAYEKSWHPTAVLGVIGACAASSSLMRLDHEQTLNALGIAASEASSLKKNFGSMMKSVHAGSAARKGLWAALLAQKGLVAGADALDGTFGYMNSFNGMAYNTPAPTDDAGPLEIERGGLVYKAYPCCGGLHAVLDCVLQLREQQGLRAGQALDIECRVHPNKVAYLDRPQVAGPLEAKFSIQYCAAAALLRGKVGLTDFDADEIPRSDIQALMKKIRVAADPTLAGFAAEVRVRMVDGQTISSRVPEPKGSASCPLSEAELVAKFLDCARVVMSPARADQAAAALMALEEQGDVRQVLRLLADDASRPAPVSSGCL
ncbi:MAG TPA: MmgE/PrpD family protein, partial [Burkholderiales bacterium]|nr:MmgE/PrpD family protein [Burkholderiales bacterium]